MFRAALLSVLVAFALASGGKQWKYGKTEEKVYGPQDWKVVSHHCKERAQSPINIDSSEADNNPDLKGLSFTCDNKKGKVSGRLTNNGHAPTLSIDKSKGTATLTGGPLGDSKYELEQIHFHFGCDDDTGSEHTVDGKAFSGELHLVTYNTKYRNFDAAADKPDGLSVIGVFLTTDNPPNDQVSSFMKKISKAGSSVAPVKLNLYDLVPVLKGLSKPSFFSYKGSLTTPPCYQSVSWIVLKEPIPIGGTALDALRSLKNHEKRSMCGNFRPTQLLNGRTVNSY